MHGRVYPDPKSVTTVDSNNNDNKPNIGPKTTEKAKPQPPTWDMKKILDEVRLARSPVNTQSSVRLGHHRLDYEEKVEMSPEDWQAYLRMAGAKCRDWVEKSRPYFPSLPIEEKVASEATAASK